MSCDEHAGERGDSGAGRFRCERILAITASDSSTAMIFSVKAQFGQGSLSKGHWCRRSGFGRPEPDAVVPQFSGQPPFAVTVA
jgi:hypothetical protein